MVVTVKTGGNTGNFRFYKFPGFDFRSSAVKVKCIFIQRLMIKIIIRIMIKMMTRIN